VIEKEKERYEEMDLIWGQEGGGWWGYI